MKNTCPVYIVFQILKVLLDTATRSFVYCFLLAFTLADIIFYKFLELHSPLSEKKDFCHKLSFFNRFTETPTLLTAKIC